MLVVPFGSHARIRANLTDEDGGAVTGATLLVTITDREGDVRVDGEQMSDDGAGVYSYLASPTELTRREHRYKVKVEATSSGLEREAEVALFTAIDAD